MKLFIDSGHIDDIKTYAELGILSGCTTNPTLLAKEGNTSVEEQIKTIASLIHGPISVESVGTTWQQMVEDGKKFASWADTVVVKVPMNKEGIRATHELHKLHIPVNVTLLFSVPQALLALNAGARYISPFVGRLDDIGIDGLSLISDLSTMIKQYSFSAEIIVASVRNPVHIERASLLGAHIATVPSGVLQTMFEHPLTTAGIQKFAQDGAHLTF